MDGFGICLEVGLKEFAEGIGVELMKAEESGLLKNSQFEPLQCHLHSWGRQEKVKFRAMRKEDVMG